MIYLKEIIEEELCHAIKEKEKKRMMIKEIRKNQLAQIIENESSIKSQTKIINCL
jgi:hypothetical protein